MWHSLSVPIEWVALFGLLLHLKAWDLSNINGTMKSYWPCNGDGLPSSFTAYGSRTYDFVPLRDVPKKELLLQPNVLCKVEHSPQTYKVCLQGLTGARWTVLHPQLPGYVETYMLVQIEFRVIQIKAMICWRCLNVTAFTCDWLPPSCLKDTCHFFKKKKMWALPFRPPTA